MSVDNNFFYVERLKRADCFDCRRADCPRAGELGQACWNWLPDVAVKIWKLKLKQPESGSEYPIQ